MIPEDRTRVAGPSVRTPCTRFRAAIPSPLEGPDDSWRATGNPQNLSRMFRSLDTLAGLIMLATPATDVAVSSGTLALPPLLPVWRD